MLGLTGICLALGRIDYLRRQSDYHVRQAQKHVEILQKRTGLSEQEVRGWIANATDDGCWIWRGTPERQYLFRAVANDDTRAAKHHRLLAQRFGWAVSRPWTWVDESSE